MKRKKLGWGFFGMEGTAVFGPMVTGKRQSPGTMKLMKRLLVQYYVKQKEEANHEIFRKNI